MEDFDSNLISLMVEETMNGSSEHSVQLVEEKRCYLITISGNQLEIPVNWSELREVSQTELSLPAHFIKLINAEYSFDFNKISICKGDGESLSLETTLLSYSFDSHLKVA